MPQFHLNLSKKYNVVIKSIKQLEGKKFRGDHFVQKQSFTNVLQNRFPNSCNFIKKILQYCCFPVNTAKFLRTPILKNIFFFFCERLLLEQLFTTTPDFFHKFLKQIHVFFPFFRPLFSPCLLTFKL